MIELNKIYNMDCLEGMDKMIKQGLRADAIIADVPYGTTKCKWDNVIPFDEMWKRLKSLRSDDTPIVLFGSEPFSSSLRMSNIKEYKYDWTWIKNRTLGFLNVKKMPLKNIENILVFYKKLPTYNPQGLIRIDKPMKNCKSKVENHNHISSQNGGSLRGNYIQKFTNYPRQALEFGVETNCVHATQKPVDLMEYLIKTYTNEGDTVLDYTIGSGTTAIACINTGRNYIGFELDEDIYEVATDRIKNHKH